MCVKRIDIDVQRHITKAKSHLNFADFCRPPVLRIRQHYSTLTTRKDNSHRCSWLKGCPTIFGRTLCFAAVLFWHGPSNHPDGRAALRQKYTGGLAQDQIVKMHSDVSPTPSRNFIRVKSSKFFLDFRHQSHLTSSGFEMEHDIENLQHLTGAAMIGVS